jgi:hypothetical protein
MDYGQRRTRACMPRGMQVLVHSIIKFGIIFWGNSSKSRKIFTLQKKIIRLMVAAQHRTSRRSLFKLGTLPVSCQYILSLMNFIINNQKMFKTNSSIHNINTRNKHNLHGSNVNLSCFQKIYMQCRSWESV